MANPTCNHINSQLRSMLDPGSQILTNSNDEGIFKETYLKTPKNSIPPKPKEPKASAMPKLIVFKGELSQSRMQRVEVIIPTEDGKMITQPVVLLPLKLKDKSSSPSKIRGPDIGSLRSSEQPLTHPAELPKKVKKSTQKNPELPSNQIVYSYELGSGPKALRIEGSVPFLYHKVSKYKSNVWVSTKMKTVANSFKQRRKKLGLTQIQAAAALREILGPTFAQNSIRKFENLQLAPVKFWQIQPFLQNWITEVEKLTFNN